MVSSYGQRPIELWPGGNLRGSVLRRHSISSCTELGNDALFREIEPWFDATATHAGPVEYTVGSKLLVKEELSPSLISLFLRFVLSFSFLVFFT